MLFYKSIQESYNFMDVPYFLWSEYNY